MSTITVTNIIIFVTILLPYVFPLVNASVFRTTSQEVRVLEGEDAIILCSIKNPDPSTVVVWQKGLSILSTGYNVYQPPSSVNRIRIDDDNKHDTYNLFIRNVKVEDEGNYSCQIPRMETQHNRLVVDVPPTIDFTPNREELVVSEDDGLMLDCNSFGKPRPNVIWTLLRGGTGRPQVLIDNDNERFLRIKKVDRSDAGVYECTAHNGAGTPAKHTIKVVVEFAPILRLPVDVIYVGPGQDVSVECHFSANPDVDVVWYHNETEINFDLRENIRNVREKNDEKEYDKRILMIRLISPNDFGIYSCIGENKIGRASEEVKLDPNPYGLKLMSGRRSPYSDEYTLQWAVSSHSKLLDFVVAVKELNDSYETSWRNFTIPVSIHPKIPVHTQEYSFRRLSANASYVVLMKARNEFGYSDWSDKLTFHTAAESGSSSPSSQKKTTLLFVASVVGCLLKNFYCFPLQS